MYYKLYTIYNWKISGQQPVFFFPSRLQHFLNGELFNKWIYSLTFLLMYDYQCSKVNLSNSYNSSDLTNSQLQYKYNTNVIIKSA